MQKQENQKGDAGVIIVGVIAVAALVIGWLAFNRSGEDLIPAAQTQVEEAAERIVDQAEKDRLAAARLEARTQLGALEARTEAGAEGEEIAQGISNVQTDLRAAYDKASAEAQQEWIKLESAFNELEAEVRSGAANALESFGVLLNNLGVNS